MKLFNHRISPKISFRKGVRKIRLNDGVWFEIDETGNIFEISWKISDSLSLYLAADGLRSGGDW